MIEPMATNMTDMTAPGQPLVFTNAAATKVGELIREESNPNLKLRVFIQGGAAPASSTASPSTRTWTKAIPGSKTAA
jgi:hypothetical protein